MAFQVKASDVDFKSLPRGTLCNHFERSDLTTKVGLLSCIKANACWHADANPYSFFPRCYDLSDDAQCKCGVTPLASLACLRSPNPARRPHSISPPLYYPTTPALPPSPLLFAQCVRRRLQPLRCHLRAEAAGALRSSLLRRDRRTGAYARGRGGAGRGEEGAHQDERSLHRLPLPLAHTPGYPQLACLARCVKGSE